MSKKFSTSPSGKVKSEKKPARANKPLDSAPTDNVESLQSPDQPATTNAPSVQERHMDLTFTRSDAARKDPRLVIFNFADGRPGSVQFLRTAFGTQIPGTITMSGDFAEKTERVAKAKETPAERKARLALLPKLTLAEKIAKAEERTAKMRAKLAKTSVAPPEAVGAM